MKNSTYSVFISNLQLIGSHGLYEEERLIDSIFSISIEAKAEKVGTDFVDYVVMQNIIKQEFSHPHQLLETLAEKIATAVFNQYPQVLECQINIQKNQPPIAEFSGQVGIKLQFKNHA